MRLLPTRSAEGPNGPPIDFDQMERDMRTAIETAPPRPIQRAEPKPHTALQVIAQSIIALTWKEAEAMGKAIQAKGEGVKDGTLTAAIQAWAAEWESFDA